MTAGEPKRKRYGTGLRSDVGCNLYAPTESKPCFRVIGSSGREVTGRTAPLDRPEDLIWEEERRWATGNSTGPSPGPAPRPRAGSGPPARRAAGPASWRTSSPSASGASPSA